MVIKLLFSRFLEKAIFLALWTKASLCGKSSLSEQSLPRTPSRLKTFVPSVAKILRVFVVKKSVKSVVNKALFWSFFVVFCAFFDFS
jgi:hypothetical protein